MELDYDVIPDERKFIEPPEDLDENEEEDD